jgi:hypothetical protein
LLAGCLREPLGKELSKKNHLSILLCRFANIKTNNDKKNNTSQIINFFGYLLTIVALIFVCNLVWTQREFLLNINIQTALPISLVGILVYLIANIILATAWWMTLNWFGEIHLGFLESIMIYGKSQILKYIPGNVFYLPGRHVLSLQHGAENGPLVGAATFEIIGLFATASGISILGILFTEGRNTHLSLFTAVVILLIAITSPLIMKYILSLKFFTKKISILQKVSWGKYSHLLAIWSLYLCFFALAGFIMFLTITAVMGKWDVAPVYTVFAAFTISWLVGTITPGAPAGAGIRESVIILILSKYIGEPNSIAASLIMRIITMLGDMVFYLISLYLGRNFRLIKEN